MNPFERTALLLGTEAMERLRRAHVLVAGLGAVGSYAVEALARSGVGRLRLVDFDCVHSSNINRQLYALHSTLGQPKVEVAAARVHDINPSCAVEAMNLFIGPDTMDRVLEGPPDAVVDAIDSLNPKVFFLKAAQASGAFVVSSMGAATRLDPSAVRVGDLSETEHCPLARLLRKRLKRQGVERGIRCVYSVEPARRDARLAPTLTPNRPADWADAGTGRTGRPRATLGSVSFLTGLFGLHAAREVILHLAAARADGAPSQESA